MRGKSLHNVAQVSSCHQDLTGKDTFSDSLCDHSANMGSKDLNIKLTDAIKPEESSRLKSQS